MESTGIGCQPSPDIDVDSSCQMLSKAEIKRRAKAAVTDPTIVQQGVALSKNEIKKRVKAARKDAKFKAARATAEKYVADHELTRQILSTASEKPDAGKFGRAKAFALTGEMVSSHEHHRAAGAAPVHVQPEHVSLVEALEDLETVERLRGCPHLPARREVPVDVHGTMETIGSCNWPDKSSDITDEDSVVSLRSCNLHAFDLALVSLPLAQVMALDLSRNCLAAVPGLEALLNLRHLNLDRNWLAALPPNLEKLKRLVSITAQHNMLKGARLSHKPSPSRAEDAATGDGGASEAPWSHEGDALQIASLTALAQAPCSSLCLVDLQFNKLCCHQHLLDALQRALGAFVAVKLTVTCNSGVSAAGAYIGHSPAERDAEVLRSQIEPWSTTALRRRLVADFGQDPTNPETVPRAEVMAQLLECYRAEGIGDGSPIASKTLSARKDATVGKGEASGSGAEEATSEEQQEERISIVRPRKVVYVDGTPVAPNSLAKLLMELRAWAKEDKYGGKGRERPTIAASKYMILTSPAEFSPGSKLAHKAMKKLQTHEELWRLAVEALKPVDPSFAASFTALAVTHQFIGSPHIDKRNVGPFYGLALGGFTASAGGGIMVESSSRVVCCVDTANKLGKVDGRYPHWVAPYDEREERFSLIYYQTAGAYTTPGPAVFSKPRAELSHGDKLQP